MHLQYALQLSITFVFVLQCVVSSIFEVVGLSFFTMIALTSEKISASELIAVMTCVSMFPIFRQAFKSSQREEQNTVKRKVLSFVCASLQLGGLVVLVILTDVSVFHDAPGPHGH
jgi:hypothetical protein